MIYLIDNLYFTVNAYSNRFIDFTNAPICERINSPGFTHNLEMEIIFVNWNGLYCYNYKKSVIVWIC